MKHTHLDIALPDSRAFEVVDFDLDHAQEQEDARRLDHHR